MIGATVHNRRQSVARDVAYSVDDFHRIAEFLRRAAGIRMPDSNEALVFSRLAKRVRGRGMTRFSDYADLIESGTDAAENEAMISALTTNTTRFFREEYHFDIFARDLLPGLARSARAGGRVRLWSAGCSSGEEPYSLAATVLKHFPEAAQYDFKILATDIDRGVLQTAETGTYPANCRNAVAPDLQQLMFGRVAGNAAHVEIRADLRALITFRYMNLMEPWPVRGPFAAIFCRNVMIYMDEATQARIWASLALVLGQGAYLFIGHSERIGPEFRDRLEMNDRTTFRRL